MKKLLGLAAMLAVVAFTAGSAVQATVTFAAGGNPVRASDQGSVCWQALTNLDIDSLCDLPATSGGTPVYSSGLAGSSCLLFCDQPQSTAGNPVYTRGQGSQCLVNCSGQGSQCLVNCGSQGTSTVAAASPAGLIDLAGTGSKISDPFSLPGGVFQVCWDVSKRSPSDDNPLVVGMFIMRAGDHGIVEQVNVGPRAESSCAVVTIDAGTYNINVHESASPAQWRITVGPA